MLTLNFPNVPSTILSLGQTISKRTEDILRANFQQKLISMNEQEMISAQSELKALVNDKKLPEKFNALYIVCLGAWSSLAMAAVYQTKEFNEKLPKATTAAKKAYDNYQLAYQQLGTALSKAFSFNENDLDNLCHSLSVQRQDFISKLEYAEKMFAQATPPTNPPSNENMLFVANKVAVFNAMQTKQNDEDNTRKEQERLEKERQERLRADELARQAKQKAADRQKIEAQKRVQSNEDARLRNQDDHQENDSKKTFLPSYGASKDLQIEEEKRIEEVLKMAQKVLKNEYSMKKMKILLNFLEKSKAIKEDLTSYGSNSAQRQALLNHVNEMHPVIISIDNDQKKKLLERENEKRIAQELQAQEQRFKAEQERLEALEAQEQHQRALQAQAMPMMR